LSSLPEIDEFLSSGFFVLRTPALPIEEFLKLSCPAAVSPGVRVHHGGDRASARAHLRTWVERPEVREALWLASPELVQSLATWQNDPESAKGRRLEHALYRYFARMTARATPFGAFAGCSLGEIAADTRLELGQRSQYKRSTRLDMEYLCNLTEMLSADPAQRVNIRFRLNTSLHLAAGKYHHLRGDWTDGGRFFQLVATDPTPFLDASLLRAASGATAEALAAALVESDPDITVADAHVFIARLVESQLLVSELAPPVIGTEPITHITDRLEGSNAAALAEGLRSLALELGALDRRGLGPDLQAYEAITGAVSRIGSEFTPGRLVQVDVMKPAVATLDQRLVNDVLRGVQTLHSIRFDATQSAFEPFKEQFLERYQEREVPLLEALDDEAGIGFESEDNPNSEPLIAGIDFRHEATSPPEENQRQTPLFEHRFQELLDSRGMVLELDSELIDEFKVADPLPLPDAFSVMGALLPGPEDQQGFYLQSVYGPSGAAFLGRFCHADDRLTECVQKHLRDEEALHARGAAFAEVAHLPEGRMGNVVRRPALRQYEIPFLATPGLPAQRQITLSDLTVAVRDGRIVLRSRRLRREVLPRLTAAHNFTNPRCLKLYKFLCLLQHQGVSGDLSWSWGAHEQAAFLPRVTMDNIVFSLARWRIHKETAPELFSDDDARQAGLVEQWRASARVPRFVYIAEADNQLLIDFESTLSVETLLDHIQKRPETILVEMLPGPDALPVRGPEGSFVHEIILPFVRKKPRQVAASVRKSAASKERAVEATGGPAAESDWFFAKLYCSPSHADRLLLELVRPLVEKTMKAGAARGWFFIRYADPRWHLRLRFHGAAADLSALVLPSLLEMAAPFQRQGLLWRMQFETYEPELERYGGPAGTGVAEQFFQLDSELCLELLPLILEDTGAELRWQVAFAGADRLLSGLGFSIEEKKSLAEHVRDSREQAWIVDDDYRKQMARKFRSGELRRTLAAIMDDLAGISNPAGPLPPEALSALARFSRRLQIIREKLKELDQAGQLTATFGELAASYVHMHLNRIFRSGHLEQEAVICDLLARTYAAKLARKNGV
jgi:thiopeptide-type bacteriocin biosynthesis protein